MHLECFGLDCMRRQRKNQLIRDLWRLQASVRGTGVHLAPGSDLDIKIKSKLNSIMKRLTVDELELLLEAVKSKGRSHNQCIHLTSHSPHAIQAPAKGLSTLPTAKAPAVGSQDIISETSWVICQSWRWPDLHDKQTLKQLPYCQIPQVDRLAPDSGGDNRQSCLRICVNPYHWCKKIDADLKPVEPDYPPDDIDLLKKIELASDSQTQTESSCPNTSCPNTERDYWCQIAYWELSSRIGQLFPVTPSSIDIFQDRTQGCGVSLDALHKAHAARLQSIASVRTKIGAGITLSNEGDLVWLYNRSLKDVFVSSYFLNMDKSSGETWRVCKVPSGHSIIIYDYATMGRCGRRTSGTDGPADPHSIHISFVKGWNGVYSRQTVLSCECWLEILINKSVFFNR